MDLRLVRPSHRARHLPLIAGDRIVIGLATSVTLSTPPLDKRAERQEIHQHSTLHDRVRGNERQAIRPARGRQDPGTLAGVNWYRRPREWGHR